MYTFPRHCLWLVVTLLLAGALPLRPQVTHERLPRADEDRGNWLTYSGSYQSHRYSRLDQVNRRNAAGLRLKCVYQLRTLEKVETTPLVVDGVMYLTQPPNDVIALDAETGRPYWTYRRTLPQPVNVCCGQVNRGLAMLGDRLFMGTVDGFLVAPDSGATTTAPSSLWMTRPASSCGGRAPEARSLPGR